MRTNSSATLRIVEDDKLLHNAEDVVLLDVREFVLLSLCVEEEDKLICGAKDRRCTNSYAILRM